jgi:hypothetical protein
MGDNRTVVFQRVVTVMDSAGRKAEVVVFIVHVELSDISYNAML